MDIQYSWCKDFQVEDLKELFGSLGWSSGQYPADLVKAMRGSHSVYTAWAEGKLVGLINALSDGAMIVYFHYLLVNPEFQGRGIGKRLVEGMLEEYQSLYRKVLISYNTALEFYEKCGFQRSDEASPVGITSWS